MNLKNHDNTDEIGQEIYRLIADRSEEHTSELQSLRHLVCRLRLEKKNKTIRGDPTTHQRRKLSATYEQYVLLQRKTTSVRSHDRLLCQSLALRHSDYQAHCTLSHH